jgi:RNA polymerase sigma-70 factor (ECF subfamily)
MTVSLEPHRALLWKLCYRMTGSAADAEDLVQETFARAVERPPPDRGSPIRPWLVQVALNLSRDHLRRRKRRSYIGPWLPSPVELAEDDFEPGPDARYDLAESASFAFLLALEALTPGQRAVLILRDVFDHSVEETAAALGVKPGAVKTLHHRARAAMARYDQVRARPSRALMERTRAAFEALLAAVGAGDAERVRELLAADARALTDAGGEFRAALLPIRGRDKVARFLLKLVAKHGPPESVSFCVLNGLPAAIASYPPRDSRLASRLVVRADIDPSGRVRELHVVMASSKLTAIAEGSAQRAQRLASRE